MVERRSFLGGVASLLLLGSGCASLRGNSHQVDDLVLYNPSDSRLDVSVRVVADSGTELLDEAVSLPSKEQATFQDPIPNNTRAEVTVEVIGGPEESYVWSPETLDSRGLLVEVSKEEIVFSLGEN